MGLLLIVGIVTLVWLSVCVIALAACVAARLGDEAMLSSAARSATTPPAGRRRRPRRPATCCP
jgi:hypothetical protein